MRVAQKWGFKHMGKFSKYYTELFGENPSVTLRTVAPIIDGMSVHCVERKEEMV
ncbi:MAG TPA: helix-turn-helix domain-containing protein, partial [Epsilonproteobacteria bacterium]|nr:helix-turn-helix domain-containing protein [Campylobacterota bacterium]